MHAHGFKDVLNRDGVTLELAGRDGAAVKNKSGNIQASQGHDAAGNGFVTADEDDQRVEEIAARDEFDGIRDHFAADEGSAHAFRAHGDAVGDGDGVELERCAAGGANAFLHVLREFAEMIVAGTNLDPGVCHGHQRFLEVLVAETGGAKHGARGRAMCAVGESAAARLGQRVAHCRVPSMAIRCDHPEIYRPEIPGAITLLWMMAPKVSGNPFLGRHPPLVGTQTGSGIIRTTARSTRQLEIPAGGCELFRPTTHHGSVRRRTSSMKAERAMSQINRNAK